MTRLAGKTLVVIGGTTGLGLSAAQAFVGQGARVVVVGRSPQSVDAAAERLGKQGVALVGDATDSSTAPKAIATAKESFGTFDGLYHVAGGSGRGMGDGPLHELTDAGLTETMSLNFNSLVYSNRAAVQAFLRDRTPGSILNMSSVLGFSPSPRHFSTHAYAAAKAAIVGLSKSVAAYYAKDDIRVNVIAPALVETPMSARVSSDDEIRRFISTKQPLDGGRIGRPEDLDEAAIYFMSNGSKFATGQVLAVDGGWTVSEGQYGP